MGIRRSNCVAQCAGYTAVEVMVVVAIVVIIAAVALPSFKGMVDAWRVRQTVESMQSALLLARSEAIRRSGSVVLQKITDTSGACSRAATTNEWGCGWIVCADTDGNGSCGTSEPVLQRFETPALTEVQRRQGGAQIAFNRWGRPSAALGFSFFPQDTGTSNAAARGLCMSIGGRVRIINDPPCS